MRRLRIPCRAGIGRCVPRRANHHECDWLIRSTSAAVVFRGRSRECGWQKCPFGVNIREQTSCDTHRLMHECNGAVNFRSHPAWARALCLSSQSAPFNMRSTYRKCGADEGQMRELIGYLVAREGAEQAAARVAVGISQRFLCEHFLCKDDGRITLCSTTSRWAPAAPRALFVSVRASGSTRSQRSRARLPARACSIEAPWSADGTRERGEYDAVPHQPDRRS